MFKFCVTGLIVGILGTAVCGYLAMYPPILSAETLEPFRIVFITVLILSAAGTLFFAAKRR